jgi:hypothetical protein
MPRSGTSVVTELLTNMGCYPGPAEDLLPVSEYNKQGYFESRHIVDINEKLLCFSIKTNLTELSDLFELTEENIYGYGWLLGPWSDKPLVDSIQPLNFQINNIVSQYSISRGDNTSLVIKDPRLCLTLPVWREAVGQTVAILMIRNPRNVASSLWRRDRIFSQLARDLWLLCNDAMLQNTCDLPKIIIDFDRLLTRPEETIEQVTTFLVTNKILSSSGLPSKQELAKKVMPELSHTKAKLGEPNQAANVEDVIYTNIIKGQIPSNISKFVDRKTWPKTLYLLIPKRGNILSAELAKEQGKLARLNNHPISGPVLRLLRIMKRDPSFGSLK